MSPRTTIARLRAAVQSIRREPALDLSAITGEERATWEALEEKRASGPCDGPTMGLDRLTCDEREDYRALLHKLMGLPPPHAGITFGHYTVPPRGHPQRADYEAGLMGFHYNDPNGHPYAPPVARTPD